MSNSKAHAFLDDQLKQQQNTVTYRFLSRKLEIHVNAAKNELLHYYHDCKKKGQPIFATFLVSGQISAHEVTDSDVMEVDDGKADKVTGIRTALVHEPQLEGVMSSFTKVSAVHIYSLSGIEKHNLKHICESITDIRDVDARRGRDFQKLVGKVFGVANTQQIKATKRVDELKTLKAVASTSKLPAPPPGKPKVLPGASPNNTIKAEKDKPKGTGKLDWSNAKSKESLKKQDDSFKVTSTPTNSTVRGIEAKIPHQRRDMTTSKKAKNVAEVTNVNDEPQASPVSKPPITTRVKRGAVLSDDDEDEDGDMPAKPRVGRKSRLKSAAIDDESETEKSLRAMMDVDDSEVIRVSRDVQPPTEAEAKQQDTDVDDVEEPSQAADSVMDEDSDPAPKVKPRKRKEKKVIPLGRNGLKKRRVVKSRTKEDAKGYIVTEDYSSYESVDEEEEEEEKPTKGKAIAKSKDAVPKTKAASLKTDDVRSRTEGVGQKPSVTANKMASSGALKRRPSAGSQNNLMKYFAGGAKPKK